MYSQGYAVTQMDIQIPFELSTGPTTLTVTINGSASSAYNITLAATSPSFTVLDGNGMGLATIYQANTTNYLLPTAPRIPALS